MYGKAQKASSSAQEYSVMEEKIATETESEEVEAVEVVDDEVEAVDAEAEVVVTAEVEVENEEAADAEVEEEEVADTEEESTEDKAVAESTPASIDDLKPKMKLDGIVTRLELYGAFIDLGVGTNALIHISKLGKDQVNRVSDVLQEGDNVSVWVERVKPEQGQIMVTMVEPLAVEWSDLKKGQTYDGTVSRLEKYGVFVDIGAEREGLVHISEISHDYVKHPSELLSVGDEVQVQVLDFNKRKRRIDLSIKNLQERPEAEIAAAPDTAYQEAEDFEEDLEDIPTAMEVALRRAMGDEPIDALEGQGKGRRKKDRRKKRRKDQEDLLNRTLQLQQDS
jgi:small subunit ribosomal protein S1